MPEQYVLKNGSRLRCGYTTGSCAAGAAKAAVRMLLTGTVPEKVTIHTPQGQELTLSVEEPRIEDGEAICAIRKDGGDDIDATDGILIFASAKPYEPSVENTCAGEAPDSCSRNGCAGKTADLSGKNDFAGKESPADTENIRVIIRGGEGVGVVTRPGLDQPVGSAAINSVPRQMIRREVEEVMDSYGCRHPLLITISVPDGRAVAEHTFNPRFGIVGGISILGTSGIVEPMSDKALLDTIRIEMRQRRTQGETDLILAPGNFGLAFLEQHYGIPKERAVKCSNFIGDTLDMAMDMHFEHVLLVGHIGKLVKIGSGVMNTHSHIADARLETFAACGIEAGVATPLLQHILTCNTTEDAIETMMRDGIWQSVLDRLLIRIDRQLRMRVQERMQCGCVLFSTRQGYLGETQAVPDLIRKIVKI